MPEHRLPEQANAGLPLQPVWHKSVRHESRNARSFAQRLYHFLNASALSAVSSRTLTIAILALAAWLATPTTAQAQEACVEGQVLNLGENCFYHNSDGAGHVLRLERVGRGCLNVGTTLSRNPSLQFGCVDGPFELKGLEVKIPQGNYTVVGIPLYISAPVPNQTYLLSTTITDLTLPAAYGVTGTPNYSLTGLPATSGLSFNKATQVLSGTPNNEDTDDSPLSMTYTVSDDNGPAVNNSLTFTITINAVSPPTFSGQTVANQTYTQETAITDLTLPEANGGTGNLSYALTGLPATSGLSFDSSSRVLSGTPTLSDTSASPLSMTYTVSDANGPAANPLTFTITISASPTPTFSGQTVANQTYTQETAITDLTLPEANGGTGNLSYALTGLPATSGLSFDSSSRVLSGTPTLSDTSASPLSMTYTVSDDSGPAANPLTFTITINASPTPTFSGQTVANQTYTQETAITDLTLPEANGGSGDLSYALTGLPATSGLSFDSSSRVLSGTPTLSDTSASPLSMTYTVSDANGPAANPLTFTITINASPTPTFSGQTVANQTYTQETAITDLTLPEANGGTGNLSYALTGLPATSGLSFDSSSRVLSGTPTLSDTSASPLSMTYTVSDANGPAANPLTFTITINASPTPTFSGQTVANQTYTQETAITDLTLPEANGGTGTLSYSLTGLPATSGLSFDSSSRVLSGTPTLSDTSASPLSMTYTVSDANGPAANPLTFTITINASPTPTFSGQTVANQTYTQETAITDLTLPVANGGTGNLSYALTGLPNGTGLVFTASSRVLSGTPTLSDTNASPLSMTYTVSDDNGPAANPLTFTISVSEQEAVSEQAARLERVNQSTLSQATQVMAANVAASVVARIESLASGDGRASVQFAGQSSLHQALKSSEKLPNSGTLALEKLLDDSSFMLPLTATEADGSAGPGGIAVWGSGDYLKFSGGKNKAMSWDGDMISAHLGVDKRFRSNILAGLAASWYKGRLDYSDSTDAEVVRGMQENEMVVLHPYVGWTSSGGVSLWATLGYGWGDLDIVEASQDKRTSDSTLQTAAIGMGGNLLSSEDLIAGGTTTLRLKGDASYAKIKVKDNGAIRGLSIAVRRLRLSLEGSHEQRLASGDRLEPSVVVGLRHDSGDSETGTGIELGGGLRYIAPAAGLSLTGRGHVLVNGPGNYEEWGANLQFLLDPGIVHQGLSLNLRSLYGEMPSERLWDRDLTQVSASTINNINNKVLGHLDMEIGYGLAAPVGPALWTPYSGLMLSSDGKRGYRLGGRFELGPLFELRLEGDRQEGTNSAQHGLLLQGQLRF